jgi:dTDP-glucose 4,6-dehydratase
LKKLLILGGSGPLGRAIVDFGIKKKLVKDRINQIYILSRKKKSSEIKHKHICINFISKNLLKTKKIPEVDYVIYCIKNNDIKKSEVLFNHFVKLLKKLKKKPKILFTSSGAVYGKNKKKEKDRENKVIKIETINAFDGYKKDYAKEKIFIEKKFQLLALKNYKVSIARCYTFIGKNIINHNYAVSDLINDAINKTSIKLKTSINVYRSYMHEDDLSKWLIRILKNSNNKCPIYNVGSDKVINLRALTKKISYIVKKKPIFKRILSDEFDYYVPSIEKAKKNLNLKISINLNDSINSTIKSLND